MEKLRTVRISVELDTNKATYSEDVGNVEAFVEWWNDHATGLGLPTLAAFDGFDSIMPQSIELPYFPPEGA